MIPRDQEMMHKEHEPSSANKQKREVRTVTSKTLSKSLSRLSLSQPTTKKPCSSARRADRRKKKQQTCLPQARSQNHPSFLSVPDAVFKQQLLAEVQSDRTTIERWLETEAMLQFARRSACLTSDVCYWKAEQDFWELYMTTAIAEANWLSQLPKNMQKRQKAIRNKLAVAVSQLNEHLQQSVPSVLESSEPMNDTVNNLSAAVLSLVHNGQQRLRDEFKRKEATLKSDINDIRLIRAFWELRPTQEQVRLQSREEHMRDKSLNGFL